MRKRDMGKERDGQFLELVESSSEVTMRLYFGRPGLVSVNRETRESTEVTLPLAPDVVGTVPSVKNSLSSLEKRPRQRYSRVVLSNL